MVQQFVSTGTILDKILARTAIDVDARRQIRPAGELERMIAERSGALSLKQSLARPELSVIAEIKRASPSRGRFPVEIEPGKVAADYIAGGAAGLSVLTDEPFFQGSLADLSEVETVAHGSASTPVLRKDFMLDEYQILEARAFGADAILLIVAALETARLKELLAFTRATGVDALVEVHTEAETEIALDIGADLIGINNRDLHTFVVDLAVTERLTKIVPPGAVLVGESGIFTGDDAVRMADAGVDAILVGESLIVAPDRAAALRTLTGAPVAMRQTR
jgi:indole-3-glycerol phosphate synthase